MVADGAQVFGHGPAARLFLLACTIVHVGRERYLGVDDHPFAVRQVQDDVRPEVVPFGVLHVGLCRIVDAFLQIGTFENGVEYHFAPVALYLAVAPQGGGKVVGLLGDAAVELHQTVEFRLEGAAVLVLFGVDFLHPLLEAGDVVLQRLQNDVERLFVDILELARLAFEDVVGGLLELEHQHLVLLLQLLSLFVEPGRERFDVLAGCHEVELPCAQLAGQLRTPCRFCSCAGLLLPDAQGLRVQPAALGQAENGEDAACGGENDSGDYQKDLHIVLFRRRALQSYPFFSEIALPLCKCFKTPWNALSPLLCFRPTSATSTATRG